MPLKKNIGLTPLQPLVLVPEITGSSLFVFFHNLCIWQFAGHIAEIMT